MYPPGQPYPQQPGYPVQGPSPYAGQAPYGPPMAHGGYQGYQYAPPGYAGGYAVPELASWGRRFGGYLIDYLVQMVIAAAVFGAGIALAFGAWELVDPNGAGGQDPPAIFFILFVLSYLAVGVATFCYRWLPHANSGKTLGKRAVGIRLIKETTGQSVGKGASAGRELVLIALSSATCGVGILLDGLWPLWDDKNQTLHDKAVSGIVIRE
ncbi:putative RDD family membrane protein YckC [Lipingzhangella halophila]|uniref:Putative RDD family membrane protein YckC n=1 Tax=Lipingzhangella halophila TaxID=1783352 RepID=A0A7W7RD15_9ACTN|nr:RDD family protein [Lipingzhangella halophila]MBB4929766.1 putative RDD family membrane protein YckC [Lipingzhangella halophila]